MGSGGRKVAGDEQAAEGHLQTLKTLEAQAAALQVPNAYGALLSQAGENCTRRLSHCCTL